MERNGRLIRTCHKAAGDLRDLARQRPAQAPKLMQIASRLDSVVRDLDRPLPFRGKTGKQFIQMIRVKMEGLVRF